MNFIRNVGRYFQENRAKLISFALITTAILLAVFLIFAGVERWQKSRYEKRLQTLEKQFYEADARAREAEDRAVRFEYEIEARKAELQDLQAKASAADAALKNARAKNVTLKETYETIRYVPIDPATPVSCADACTELSGLGYPCK